MAGNRLPIRAIILLLSLCGIAIAANEATLPLSLAVESGSTQHVTLALFSELEELARIVDISYCVGLTGTGIETPFQCLSRCSQFPHFELVTTWNTGPLLSDSCGYIVLDHAKRRILVAFRGTYSLMNTIVDLSTVPQKYEPYPGDSDHGNSTSAKCENCTVHMGFHSSWLNTRRIILPYIEREILLHPSYGVHLVGHSLGGAVSELAGLDLQARGWHPTVTTFGQPRVGNAAFAKFVDASFDLFERPGMDANRHRYRRVTHIDDPVPLLPLSEWGYVMHAGEIYISKLALSPDLQDVIHCKGDNDPNCIAGQDSTASEESVDDAWSKRDLLGSVRDEIQDVMHEPWGIPSRYKLWQLIFSHRDYFWRLGLCVPSNSGFSHGVTKDDL